ncbi:Krueppel-like factor 2 [Cydia pomonella]|uniref:Krueppel-like factor 2 n=1 Tax=Cydia pomonella TaxID=82600 RepID=UPI002ADD709E|nr:Krueppel-like factor 2 [Cydia pomonella]
MMRFTVATSAGVVSSGRWVCARTPAPTPRPEPCTTVCGPAVAAPSGSPAGSGNTPEHTPGTGPTGEDCRWRPAPLSVARLWPRLQAALQAPGTRPSTHRGQALQVRTVGGALHHCLWPGCGRAFRQPCRLREHARAHTGDRPYR